MTLEDLIADAENPREIDDDAAAGLAESLAEFGDVAGIVWNRRTGELVCGHQRLRELLGERDAAALPPLETDAAGAYFKIDKQRFAVRIVDWSKGKQRAASVAANNAKLQGQFTDPVAYLAPVRHELGELWDDVGLALLVPAGGGSGELAPVEHWTVVVDCTEEAEQRKLYEEFKERGFAVKLITM